MTPEELARLEAAAEKIDRFTNLISPIKKAKKLTRKEKKNKYGDDFMARLYAKQAKKLITP